MVDWDSEEVAELTRSIWARTLIYVLGLYGWQYFLTLHHVEWPLITRKLKFRFIYVPYIIGRSSLLVLQIALVIITKAPSLSIASNCAPAYKALSALGNVAVSAASTNLLFRTLALWERSQLVRIFLIFVSASQWLIGLSMGPLSVSQSPPVQDTVCGHIYPNAHHELIVFFFCTVFCDINILAFTVVGLGRKADAAGTRLWSRVYRHGFWYLFGTLMANVPVVILAGLNVNPVMSVFFVAPARVFSVITSSAAVVSLLELEGSTESHSSNGSETSGLREAEDGAYDAEKAKFSTHIDLSSSLCGGAYATSDICIGDTSDIVIDLAGQFTEMRNQTSLQDPKIHH